VETRILPRVALRRRWLLCGIMPLVSCGLREPLAPTVASPQLNALSITLSGGPIILSQGQGIDLGSRTVVLVFADLTDRTFRLAAGEREVVTIESDAGELETLSLEPYACRGNDGDIVACQRLDIAMKKGFHVSSLEMALDRLDARLVGASRSGALGRAWSLVRGAQRIRGTILTWPGVQLASLVSLVDVPCLASVGAPCGVDTTVVLARLVASARFRQGTPAPLDGIVQGDAGTAITVLYHQPDGTVLRDTLALPAR
jgi:hypothetical protein